MQESKLKRVTDVKSGSILRMEEEARMIIAEANGAAEARVAARAKAKVEDQILKAQAMAKAADRAKARAEEEARIEASGADQWFYIQDQQQIGPVSLSEMRSKVSDLMLEPPVKSVWTEGMEGWKPVYEVRILCEPISPNGAKAQPSPRAAHTPSVEEDTRLKVLTETKAAEKAGLAAIATAEAGLRSKDAQDTQTAAAEKARAKADLETQQRAASVNQAAEAALLKAASEAKAIELTRVTAASAKARAEDQAELEAKLKASEKARVTAEAKATVETQLRAAAEAKADSEAKLRAAAEEKAMAGTRATAAANAQAKATNEARTKAEEDAKLKAAEDAILAAEVKAAEQEKLRVAAKDKAAAEAKIIEASRALAQAADEAKTRAETDAKLKVAEEARAAAEAKAIEETKLRAAAEATAIAESQLRAAAERKAAAEAHNAAAARAQEQAMREARAQAEAAAKIKAAADAKAETQARLKADAQAAAAEAARTVATARAHAEAEAKLKTAELARASAVAVAAKEAKLRAAADAKADNEAKLRAAAEAKLKAEEKAKLSADARAARETRLAATRERAARALIAKTAALAKTNENQKPAKACAKNVWFYTSEGDRLGPVAFEDLRAMAADSSLNPRLDMVWRASMDGWKPAGQIDGLFERKSVPLDTPEKNTLFAASAGPEPRPRRTLIKNRDWPGARRRSLLLITLVFPFVWQFALNAGSPLLVDQFGPILMAKILPAAAFAPLAVLVHFGLKRIVNLGMSRLWCLAFFAPVLNLWVGYRCFVCPAGYAYHKKLDAPGVALAVFYWFIVLSALLSLAAFAAMLCGAIDNPSLATQLRRLFPTG